MMTATPALSSAPQSGSLCQGVGNVSQARLHGIRFGDEGSGDLTLQLRQALRLADQLDVGIQVLLVLRTHLFGERSLSQLSLHVVRHGVGNTHRVAHEDHQVGCQRLPLL